MDARTESRSSTPRKPRWMRGDVAVPVLVLLVFCAGQTVLQIARSRAAAPSSAERIYAMLVEWGVEVSGLVPPVDQAEVDRRIERLWSDDGEVRVLAACWLAARGLRDTGDQIAASMTDSGTRRPCQLAHSLGKLGDDQWIDELLVAATQPSNADLRACAAIALTDIASKRAVDALLEITREDPTRTFAVRALGEIGDPRAIDHLRWLEARASTAGQRLTAENALERVETLAQPDPIPALLQRVQQSATRRSIDEWALRHVARYADPRGIEPLSRLFVEPSRTRRTRELLAAVLLAHGDDGRVALANAADLPAFDGREIALVALSLGRAGGPARLATAASDDAASP